MKVSKRVLNFFRWFASITHGNIPHFYDVPLSQDVKLLLANALSFGGNWDQEFPAADTQS
jgi:serine protease inhibitor